MRHELTSRYYFGKIVVLVCQGLATGRWFSLGTPVSASNQNDRHVITESMRHELTSRYYFGKIVVLNEIYRGYWKFPNTFNNK
jgi:hypothetical protein